ncbi:hypothetical protein ABT202_09400 [Streptomyces sp900105245]|uniref:hypothetical protein n=1 Tax=Streptomyces sp. 900105245 TaxID=3154379 RepID=UPI00093FFF05|nr:hypothetical protein AMK32_10875 [Streptomyces sp. CB01883]
MSQPPSFPTSGLWQRALLIVIALLVGLLAGLVAGVLAVLLHATPLDAAKWAGGTFIAVTMLLLKIRELLR